MGTRPLDRVEAAFPLAAWTALSALNPHAVAQGCRAGASTVLEFGGSGWEGPFTPWRTTAAARGCHRRRHRTGPEKGRTTVESGNGENDGRPWPLLAAVEATNPEGLPAIWASHGKRLGGLGEPRCRLPLLRGSGTILPKIVANPRPHKRGVLQAKLTQRQRGLPEARAPPRTVPPTCPSSSVSKFLAKLGPAK